MACFHPLKAFYKLGNDGKKQITFYNSSSFPRPYESYPDDHKIDIPCGQCAGCRLEYSRQWAIRCMLEAQKYEHNFFVTLTYNDEHLPRKEHPFFSSETGEVFSLNEVSSLVPEDLQLFLKRLRRYFEYHYNFTGIRFFACGEYGEKNMRPHYHLILFNCPLPDLVLLKRSFNGDLYWRSEILERMWSVKIGYDSSGKPLYESKGFVCVGSCTFDSCSYVARYMMKKQKGENAHFYEDNGLISPFTRSSRDPGIARSYYDEKKDIIYEYDSLHIVDKNGVAKKVRPPRYFDRLYDIECPEDLQRIKEHRKESAENGLKLKLEHTDLSELDYLKVSENVFLARMDKLFRTI